MFTDVEKNIASMPLILFGVMCMLLLSACGGSASKPAPSENGQTVYTANGRVVDNFGNGIEGVEIITNTANSVFTDNQGNWLISDLSGQNTITPVTSNFTLKPSLFEVQGDTQNLVFVGNRIVSNTEQLILNWFNQQQLSNGLLESVENGDIVSLYDNALAAMVFMLTDDFTSAEHVFDFFNARISSELTSGVGGFSQFRSANGIPSNHRWMGDNAWLLIALNNYKSRTGKTTYNNLASALSSWLISLQDDDGGLFAGYDRNNNRLEYKVTEGNIDAFNALEGYTSVHVNLLEFLRDNRWNASEQSLVAWPENPPYLFALDLHPWSYSIFTNFPVATLISAQRFVTTQLATSSGAQITGYCFDEDKDTVWPEGTGQMALAFGIAGMQSEKQFYLNEIDQLLILSNNYSDAAGFPYASNPGTVYGPDQLWAGADTNIAISGGAWYLFAKYNFNPFGHGKDKGIPESDMFYLN